MKKFKFISLTAKLGIAFLLIYSLFQPQVSASTLENSYNLELEQLATHTRIQETEVMYIYNYLPGIPLTYFYDRDGWRGTLYYVSQVDNIKYGMISVFYRGTVSCYVGTCYAPTNIEIEQ